MQSPSDLQDLTKNVIEIDRAIRQAERMLVDAEWTGDEEAIRSLRNEIDRLNMQKALGQTHDVVWQESAR
jgi:hypothetical protein